MKKTLFSFIYFFFIFYLILKNKILQKKMMKSPHIIPFKIPYLLVTDHFMYRIHQQLLLHLYFFFILKHFSDISNRLKHKGPISHERRKNNQYLMNYRAVHLVTFHRKRNSFIFWTLWWRRKRYLVMRLILSITNETITLSKKIEKSFYYLILSGGSIYNIFWLWFDPPLSAQYIYIKGLVYFFSLNVQKRLT